MIAQGAALGKLSTQAYGLGYHISAFQASCTASTSIVLYVTAIRRIASPSFTGHNGTSVVLWLDAADFLPSHITTVRLTPE